MTSIAAAFWKHRVIGLLLSGVLLAAAGLFLLGTPIPAHAQSEDAAEYVGASECRSCHRSMATAHADSRHALTLQEPGDENVLGDFTQGEDVRQVQFPEEDAPRAFSADDIAFVVGSGRDVQRYLYKVDRNEYMVFPAEWNVTEGKWEAYSRAATWPDAAYDWTQNCVGCHTTGINVERGRWEDDAVQCEACHGPASIHVETAQDVGRNPSEEELAEVRSTITVSADAQVCGQCHGAGVESETGLPYTTVYRPGGDLATSFTLSLPDDSAHWRSSGHAASQNMQYNEWMQSGHARSLDSLKNSTYAEDSCLECHSGDYRLNAQLSAATEAGAREGTAPEAVTLATAQEAVTCTACHTTHGETEQDYQLSQEPYALCVSCHADDRLQEVHNPVKAMFEGEGVVERITGVPSKHFTEGAVCTDCHMPLTLETGATWYSGSHTMQPVFPGEAAENQPDSCTACHTDLSREYMQRFVEQTQSGVLAKLNEAQAAVETRPNTPDWVLAALDFVMKDGSLGVHNFSYASSLIDAASLELGIVQSTVPSNVSTRPVENPTECAECHMDEFRQWQASPHANASLMTAFQNEYARQGRPSYCMSCHASGYDPRTEQYVFEGVVCSNCHYITGEAEHPPGPVEIATDSAVCGSCHSGEHAPTYDEWLVSSHSTAGIDCADCHTPHNNGLILNDVNSTCESCHVEAKTDDIHMGEEMSCVDCHMAKRTQENGVFLVQSGHSMSIDPGICANCHGNIHLLSAGESDLTDSEQNRLVSLEGELTQLQTEASDNLNTGIVGGAMGALVLVVLAWVVIRVGRRR